MTRAKPKAKYRFSIIPAAAVTDPDVTAQALRVLALLGRHTDDNGWCRRSQVRMAEEIGSSRATIQRALECLEEAGYVERRVEGRPGVEPEEGQHPFASYSYRVKLDPAEEAEKTEEEQKGAEVLTSEHHTLPTGEQGVLIQEEHGVPISRAPIIEPSPCKLSPWEQQRARVRERYGSRFAELVEAYDPPTGSSLSKAFEVWQGLAAKLPPNPVLVQCAAIDRDRHRERERREGRANPRCHLTRWLSEGRFETCMPEEAPEGDDGRDKVAELFGPEGVARIEQLNGRAREFFDIAAKSTIEPGDPARWRVPSVRMRERLSGIFADALRDICPGVVLECGAP